MWLYQNKVIEKLEDFPSNVFGFVYKITHPETGQFYIGRKNLQLKKTKKIGKKAQALQEGKGRKKTKEITYEESDWLTYWSSSKIIHKMVAEQGEQAFTREILEFAFTSKHLNLLEAEYQFKLEVLRNPKALNENIQARYFKKDLAF
jgi:hypothetical protein